MSIPWKPYFSTFVEGNITNLLCEDEICEVGKKTSQSTRCIHKNVSQVNRKKIVILMTYRLLILHHFSIFIASSKIKSQALLRLKISLIARHNYPNILVNHNYHKLTIKQKLLATL